MIKGFITHPRDLPVLKSFYANFPNFPNIFVAICMHNKVYSQPEYQDITRFKPTKGNYGAEIKKLDRHLLWDD